MTDAKLVKEGRKCAEAAFIIAGNFYGYDLAACTKECENNDECYNFAHSSASCELYKKGCNLSNSQDHNYYAVRLKKITSGILTWE